MKVAAKAAARNITGVGAYLATLRIFAAVNASARRGRSYNLSAIITFANELKSTDALQDKNQR